MYIKTSLFKHSPFAHCLGTSWAFWLLWCMSYNLSVKLLLLQERKKISITPSLYIAAPLLTFSKVIKPKTFHITVLINLNITWMFIYFIQSTSLKDTVDFKDEYIYSWGNSWTFQPADVKWYLRGTVVLHLWPVEGRHRTELASVWIQGRSLQLKSSWSHFFVSHCW